MNQLEGLRRHTIVVADTGDIDLIARHKPHDATTNPSLLAQAASDPRYRGLVDEALTYARNCATAEAQRIEAFLDELFVVFGREITKIIPGRVSTEVDARLSFDSQATIRKAKALIERYEAHDVARERILIKVASTWEGIRAAAELEKSGIHCNLTLLFSFAQAVACAEAGVTLVSPFVGRIYDWHLRNRQVQDIPIADDPGVASVVRIYDYFKKFEYKTEVMGASFRKADQVVALAGCDLLTVSPQLLEELSKRSGEVERRLAPETSRAKTIERITLDEKTYRWLHNQDAMAVDKLADGIRRFDDDARKLERLARAQMVAS